VLIVSCLFQAIPTRLLRQPAVVIALRQRWVPFDALELMMLLQYTAHVIVYWIDDDDVIAYFTVR